MKTYNVAVIGSGFMGRTHSLCAVNMPFFYDSDVRPVLHTLCGRDEEKTARLAARFGFAHAAADFESVINDPRIDVVDICTPGSLHYAQAKAAILAGKAVYCEKPLTVTYAEACELAELASQKNVCCGVAFQHRAWLAVQTAKTLDIGDVISFRGAFLHSSLVDESKPYGWRNAPVSEGGGVLCDLGSHLIDLVMYLAGDIADVSARFMTKWDKRRDGDRLRPVLSDDAAVMTVRLKNGACGTLEASKLATGQNDRLYIEVCGTDGAFRFDLENPSQLRVYKNGAWEIHDCMQKYPAPCDYLTGAVLPGWLRAHLHSYYGFMSALAENRQPCPSFDDAARVQRIIEKARQSAL